MQTVCEWWPCWQLERVLMASLHDMESLLYEAIVDGNLPTVKRMVNSGIGRNAVLHSPRNWEAATILSTAAFYGNLQIVSYLIEAGASINFQDPGVRRSALHWASMGQGTNVVKYLISRGADVNALDRDNMSPVMLAALHSHQEAVRELVEAGAYVNGIDRLRCTALHYAAFHGDPVSVRALVLGGCVHNNAIFVKGTPLGNLATSGDIANVQLLLAAGCNMSAEDWKQQVEGVEEDSEVFQLLKEHVHTAPSLKQVCRVSIRGSLQGQQVQKKILQLPLPSSLIDYLLLLY
ncbi:uncharacterized protein LOC143297357 [Babylonia areolata]|uniref:uncharacterized protein LOC143297357 n=1 Tax=Babylonia areolata TaxID=304850 RepID=UPI003FD50424